MNQLALVCYALTLSTVAAELPDALVMQDGTLVTTADQWRSARRPELVELFQKFMYGHLPPKPAHLTATAERVDTNYFGGQATRAEVTLRYGPPDGPPLRLLLVTPNGKKPAPVFVCLNFNGNTSVLAGAEAEAWNVERTITRGYAFATFHNADIEPDHTNAPGGTRARYPDHDWGAVAAWAWGLHRAIDYLETNPAIDARHIAAFGFSRNGKAALLAAAMDERIALVIPHQAGCGGTAPNRSEIGGQPAAIRRETVKVINEHFPHWFNATFKKYGDAPETMPFDQHELMALVAPRGLLISVAEDDTWSNPPGQFAMMRAAAPVWRMLGAGVLRIDQYPGAPVLPTGRPGFYYRKGAHAATAGDWAVFLDYADQQFADGSRAGK